MNGRVWKTSKRALDAQQKIAICLAYVCVRNTHIEELHGRLKGFTDAEMKKLMKEVVNKLYTAINNLFNPSQSKREEFMEALLYLSRNEIADWSVPVRDKGIDMIINLAKAERNLFRRQDERRNLN